MQKKIISGLFLVMFTLGIPGLLYADSIRLKSGKTIEADIVEKKDNHVKLNISGVDITYYLNEISSINNIPVESGADISNREEQLSDEEAKDIKKLLELTGALAIGQQFSEFFIDNMTQIIKQSQPSIPAEMLDILKEEANKIIAEAIDGKHGYIELMIKLYSKHFRHDDIKGLIEFYQTDLGKKIIKVMPILMQESLAIGQIWGQALEPTLKQKIIERFKKEGFDIAI